MPRLRLQNGSWVPQPHRLHFGNRINSADEPLHESPSTLQDAGCHSDFLGGTVRGCLARLDQDVLRKMKRHFLPLHGVPLPPFAGVVTTLPPYSQHDEALWRALRVVTRLLELLYVY